MTIHYSPGRGVTTCGRAIRVKTGARQMVSSTQVTGSIVDLSEHPEACRSCLCLLGLIQRRSLDRQ